MAHAAPSPPGATDDASGGRSAWKRPMESRFVWVAPSPSPAEVTDLELRFPEVVQVPIDALAEESSRWESNAILARSINRWVPPDAIIRELRRGGVPGEVEAVCLAHRCFILRFSDLNAKTMVLSRPWVVNGQPLATEEWYAEFVPAESSVPSALLWIRLPLLPMEFWTEEILRSIVAPAGEFLFSDPSTKAKNRGGFARICVRVDLSKPLRPGARIRGRQAPFWQQYSYEHLEGICGHCGSLHYFGPCSPQPDASSSSTGTKFGPWMAAVRQRRSSPDSSDKLRRKKPTGISEQGAAVAPQQSKMMSSSVTTAAAEVWRTPVKVARRRPSKPLMVASSPGSGAAQAMSSVTVPVRKGRASFTETVAETVAETETESLNVQTGLIPQVQSLNPFSLLGSDKWAGRPKVNTDTCPGPSKRARPEETTTLRVVSKNSKGKGKAKLYASKLTQANAIPSDTTGSPGAVIGRFPKEKDVDPELTRIAGQSHDLVLSHLKGAIGVLGNNIPTNVMETTQLIDTSGHSADGGPSDFDMPEDQDGSQPPPTT